MSSNDPRPNVRADRPHSRGRRPMILRFEPLEERQVLSTIAATGSNSGAAATGAARTASADLVIQNIQTESYRAWGDEIRVQGSVLNQGNARADQDFKVDVYISTKATLDSTSIKLGSIDVTDPVTVGAAVSFDETLELPDAAPFELDANKPIYIGLVADGLNVINESNETNNYNRAQGVDSAAVLLTERAPSQLVAKSFTIDESSAHWGDEVTVKMRVENLQAGEAPGTRAIIVMTPTNVLPGTGYDVTIADDIEVPALGAYGSTEVSQKIALPPGPVTGGPASGAYALWVLTDADHLTNPINTPVLLQAEGVDHQSITLSSADGSTPAVPIKPDVATANVLTPGTPLTWGSPFQVATTVLNRGETASGPLRVRFLLGGPNGEAASALVLGDATIENLAAGESISIVQDLKLPSKLPFGMTLAAGTGRVIAVVDPENRYIEPDESNNAARSGVVTLQLPGNNTTPATPVTPTTPTTPNTPTPIKSRNNAQQAANRAAQQAARAQKNQERRNQLQALRQSLMQRRTQESTPRMARGASSLGATQATANTPNTSKYLTIYPNS